MSDFLSKGDLEEYNYYPYKLVFDQTQAASVIKKLIIFIMKRITDQ